MLLARIFFGDIEYNVIFNSVNLEKFAPKMSKNNDDLTFIHVGRYTYQKNQELKEKNEELITMQNQIVSLLNCGIVAYTVPEHRLLI